ncbi:MAG: type I-C CRISPR-associated protein Cas8c/Csd1 [Atopobiaceae bacterium]|nr:type I-C CRISPR-associated protein Cas8c/Csd1 [Atopobiaceae bacterium]
MLAELVSYYEQLAQEHPDRIAPMGWCARKVSFALELGDGGDLRAVMPLTDAATMYKMVPTQVKRAVNIAANYLCDNSSYFLGVDNKGKPERTRQCFEAAKELHHNILDGIDSSAARAILAFFDSWVPEMARDHRVLKSASDKLFSGGNIFFAVVHDGRVLDTLQDESLRNAWESHITDGANDSSAMRCLVTGEVAPVARLHPAIKGVYGAQSSGASLVSFNARAFESYGHDKEQGRNAPVSERAAEAYGTALNYLLSDQNHHIRLGDTTIVYWSDHKDSENCQAFSMFMGGGKFGASENNDEETDRLIDAVMKSVARGKCREIEGIDTEATFYVLGLAPSAARLSVKFFLRSSFGTMLRNLADHYRRADIVHAPYERDFLSPYQLLREVENPKAKKPVVTPILNGPLLRSMLLNTPYPEALYTNALLRIHATQENPDEHTRKVTRGRAAIIRAYLLKNKGGACYEEGSITVKLNEERNETAYCLGRAFAILEWIQEAANGKATITNRYFNSASTTPSVVFPTLIHLSQAHLQKVKRDRLGYGKWLEQQLFDVLDEDRVRAFPRRLALGQQGDFILGYVHQKNKRYEPKAAVEDAQLSNEEE